MKRLGQVYSEITSVIEALNEAEKEALLREIDAQIGLMKRAGVKPKGALKRRLAVYTAILELMEKQL